MKMLFDENLSPRLVRLLVDIFPNSMHVRDVGLEAADDPLVWDHAKNNGLILVFKRQRYASTKLFVWSSSQNRLGPPRELLNQGC
jgi:predicted nuclease of predicted toxin-antitoxin system